MPRGTALHQAPESMPCTPLHPERPPTVWQDMVSLLTDLQRVRSGSRKNVLLIVNSRMALGAGLDGAAPMALESLKPEAAEKLLLQLSGPSTEWRDGEATRLVAEVCGCNALAVTVLAGFLAHKRCTPQVRRLIPGGECAALAEAVLRIQVHMGRCCLGAGRKQADV
jgi:hypothetical protein